MGQQGGHVGGGEVPDVPDPEAGGVGDLARVDHLTWRGVDWGGGTWPLSDSAV